MKEDTTVTASTIIAFAEKLEEDTSKFYEELAEKYTENRETLLSFAKESKRNKILLLRTYQETITDALEACFININLSDYLIKINLREGMSYYDALKLAVAIEEKACKFYSDVAERSGALLATITDVFRKVAKIRENRKYALKLKLKTNPI